jgi:hypothetical protein
MAAKKKKTQSVSTGVYRVQRRFYSAQYQRNLKPNEVVELEEDRHVRNALQLNYISRTDAEVTAQESEGEAGEDEGQETETEE